MSSEESSTDEELIFGSYGGGTREPVDLLSDYVPEKEDWGAKTKLKDEQVAKLIAVEMLPDLYPELEHRRGLIYQWIDQYEKRLTSVGGMSRAEYHDILVAISGGRVSADETKGLLERIMTEDVTDRED